MNIKNGVFYAPGTQDIASSKVATIINRSNSTTIKLMGDERIPHPLLGSQYKKFVAMPGVVTFGISFTMAA